MMSSRTEFQQLTISLRQANAEVSNALSALLVLERRQENSIDTLHSAVRRFGDAAQASHRCLVALCELLALDAEGLNGGPLDDLVPPILEHDEHS